MRPPRSRRPRRVFGSAFAIAATLASAGRVYETSTIGRLLRADQGDKLDALLHMCRAMLGRSVVVDVHGCDRVLSHHEFLRHAERAVPKNLPRGVTVTFRSWTERRGGERFHNRYVITDVGGVQFGDGIERGHAGQFDRLSLLGHDERLRLWNQFYGAALAFDLAGEVKISSTS